MWILFLPFVKTLDENNRFNLTMYGDWADSSLCDEASFFFNYTNFNNFSSFQIEMKKLQENDKCNANDILEKSKAFLSKQLLGLLNLSLNFRVFHPEASIKNPINKSRPHIRGYSIYYQTSCNINYSQGLASKFISAMYSKDDPVSDYTRFITMKNCIQHFPTYYSMIQNYPPDLDLLSTFQKEPFSFTPRTINFLANGRIMPQDPYSSTSSLINEANSLTIMRKLGMSNDLTYRICHSPISIPSHLFIKFVPDFLGVILNDNENLPKDSYIPKKLDANSDNFLECQKNLIKYQCFIKVADKNSQKLLQYLVDEIYFNPNDAITVFPIFDINNIFELQIVNAFYQIFDKKEPRYALRFLLEGLKHGFESAYSRFKLAIQWNELSQYVDRLTKEMNNYIQSRNIKETVVLINGDPTKEIPIPEGFNKLTIDWEAELKESVKNNELNFSTKMEDYLSSKGIPISKFYPSLFLNTRYIKFYSIPINTQLQIIEQFSKLESTVLNEFKEDFTSIPIFYYSYNDNNIQHIDHNIQHIDHNNLNNHSFIRYIENNNNNENVNGEPFNNETEYDESFSTLLDLVQEKIAVRRIERNSSIVNSLFEEMGLKIDKSFLLIGGLIIETPNLDLIEFSLHYLKKSIGYDFPSTLTMEQLLYLYFWRTSQDGHGISRSKPIIPISRFKLNIGRIDAIDCEVISDPFQPEFRESSEFISIAYEMGAIGFRFIPFFIQLYNTPEQLTHLSQDFYPVFLNDSIEVNSNFYLEKPNDWVVEREKTNFVLTRIATYITAYNINYFKIFDQERIPRSVDGSSIIFLPIGRFKTLGIYEKEIEIKSLSPIHLYLSSPIFQDEKITYIDSKNDNYLNVLTFCFNKGYEEQTKGMMYTLEKNSSRPVKWWIIGDFYENLSPRYNITFLPYAFPPDLIWPADKFDQLKLMKFAVLDQFFPPYVHSILFCDPGTIWRGNAARFLGLNMSSFDGQKKMFAFAAPEISDEPRKIQKMYFAQKKSSRPFHSTAVFFANLDNWRIINSGNMLKQKYMKSSLLIPRDFVHSIDNDLFNELQLTVQVYTLPADTCFCDQYLSPSRASDALAISLCSDSTIQYLDLDNIYQLAKLDV